jgi:hypothetical protein
MMSYRTAVAIDAEVATFAQALTKRLQKILGEDLHGAYLSGSVALGGYLPGQSDIDLLVVSQSSLKVEKKRAVAQVISDEAANCPTRGMEFILYSRQAVAKVSRTPRFEINLNAGPQMPYHLSFDPASEPSHWFVLDISIVREHGLQLIGPPAAEVFAPIPRSWVLDALEDSLGWHADHESLLHYSVLNACRSWRYAEEGVMSSKDDAAVWALSRAEDPSIIDSALAIRKGDRTRSLESAEVRAFVLSVKVRVARMPR